MRDDNVMYNINKIWYELLSRTYAKLFFDRITICYIPGSSLCPDGAAVHCAHVGNPFSTSHVGQSWFLSATQNIWKIIQCHFVNSVFLFNINPTNVIAVLIEINRNTWSI